MSRFGRPERPRGRRHPERGAEAMADLFFVGLIIAVFVGSALFIPLLRRN
jgi:hypothetical protein